MTDGLITLDDLLAAYAAGRLAAPVGLAVATHLALRPASRRRVAAYEAVGGAVLETLPPDPVPARVWDCLLERLGSPDLGMEEYGMGQDDARLPAPLRPYAPGGLAALGWRRRRGVAEVDLPLEDEVYRTRLVTLGAGRRYPHHAHGGHEILVLIEGSYDDGVAWRVPGDLTVADPSIEHGMQAGHHGPCLCLLVTDGPLRLAGPFGRWLAPFVRL